MHPSGYQIAVSCIDKIVINLIFHDSLRAINTLPIGGAHILKYSRGGHLLLVVDKNGIRAFNAYTMKQVSDTIRRDGTKIVDLTFADLDRAVAVVFTTGKIERWEIPSFTPIKSAAIEDDEKNNREKFYYKSIDFIQEGPKDPHMQGGQGATNHIHKSDWAVGVAGTDGKKMKFKIVDANNQVVKGQ